MVGVENTKVIMELKKLRKQANRRYDIEQMLLFGSRARGEGLLSSDVDVLIISKDFMKLPFKKRPDTFLDSWKLPVDLEVLCYTPDEFERKKNEIGLVKEAAKTGIPV
ncbi:MAG: nucleotidyltransferase domain-containing protein [Candidatus Altiarchaeales archaeon]|nr:nucleotidyltransferase domain-containing protein [Candidatus Altiarchaeales archaeon]